MRLSLAVLASVLFVSGSAYADTISAGAVSTITLAPASDTVGFSASSGDVNAGGTFTQSGTFYVGDSEIPNQTIPFTFADDVTVNGITEGLVFTGQDDVTTGPDVITIDALGPVYFGNTYLVFSGLTVAGDGTVGQSLPLNLSASLGDPPVDTPEVSSMALVGTALIGLFMLTRPRARA